MKTTEYATQMIAGFLYSPDDGYSKKLAEMHAELLVNHLAGEGIFLMSSDDISTVVANSQNG